MGSKYSSAGCSEPVPSPWWPPGSNWALRIVVALDILSTSTILQRDVTENSVLPEGAANPLSPGAAPFAVG